MPEALKPYVDSVTRLTTEVINETDPDEANNITEE